MKRMLESLVVDLSAMLALITDSNHSIRVTFWMETASITYATDQLHIDLADYFRELVIEEKITTQTALAACEKTRQLIDHYASTESLWQESLFESLKYRITAQEIAPIILARKINASYITLVDSRRNIAESLGLNVY